MSVGYSDLFVLSKEDLWNALKEYPEAKTMLIAKGRQMLRKDNLLNEDEAKRQDIQEMSAEDRVNMLEEGIDTLNTRLARLLGEFNCVQAKLKQRMTKVEKDIGLIKGCDSRSIGQPSYSCLGATGTGEDGETPPVPESPEPTQLEDEDGITDAKVTIKVPRSKLFKQRKQREKEKSIDKS